MQEDQRKQQPFVSSARESTRLRSATSFQDGGIDTELSVRDYYSSSFPSLLTQLGTNREKRAKPKHTKREARRASVDFHGHRLRRDEEPMSFAEEMRRRNEPQWMRIQAVAKEKLDSYDRYARDLGVKVKRQREQINRRSQELLEALARQEEMKKERKINQSPHGRIWRHHRTMQRRAFSLEPVGRKHRDTYSMTTINTKVST